MFRRWCALLIFAAPLLAQDFFPVSVWYGGGKARTPIAVLVGASLTPGRPVDAVWLEIRDRQ